MLRILVWLFAAPPAALLALWLTGPVSPLTAVGAALGSQVAAYPCWQRVERRRTLAALRRRHEPGVAVLRVRLSPAELAIQLALRVAGALLVTAHFSLSHRDVPSWCRPT